MKYTNEGEIKRALGIDSWRNLSKDKMMNFVAMMPGMDTEVALKIVGQFPAFKTFALEAVDSIKQSHELTVSANERSQGHAYETAQKIIDILERELSRNELDWEQRRYIIEQIQMLGKMVFEKDSESKRFLDSALNKVLAGGVAALALGVVFVGGRILSQGSDNKGSPEA